MNHKLNSLIRKIISLFFIIVIVFNNPILVNLVQGNNSSLDKNQENLPDLVGSVDIYEKNDSYWFNFSITNNGNAPANNYTVVVTVYPFGTFLFRNAFFRLILNLPPSIRAIIVNPIVRVLHIFPFFIQDHGYHSEYPLNPGETINGSSWSPFDYDIDSYINTKICIILECVVDPENYIKESNELNNNDIIRWWFPLNTEPPSN